MSFEAILGVDPKEREEALAEAHAAPDHVRSALVGKLAPVVREMAAAGAAKEDLSQAAPFATGLEHMLRAIASMRVPAAKAFLVGIADEGTPAIKSVLARALRGVDAPEAHAVLGYLLSDEDARADAILAIAAAPWPAVLPTLIEIAEADEPSLRPALAAIARCGASCGDAERNAAADFLLEQLDDDALLPSVVEALLCFEAQFPGVEARAAALVRGEGEGEARKIAGLCLLAGAAAPDETLATLARAAAPRVTAEAAAELLRPLLASGVARVRQTAERVARVL
jgi:hypothetical protein